ncbi:hypothetical protein [Mycoplasmopsis cynos]|uniref:hypothetical protein n=1 Tax=Mycoplasmopsis cynos TaxID=171284 RepID=UPI002206AF83|nr:hypothetical protein [Mycoplasmopsis cynos]UWV77041.1 hypothetical protein NW070_04595 [Mycoplasmopsis cynos]
MVSDEMMLQNFGAQNTWYSKDKKEKALSSVIDGKRFKFNTNVNISYNSELDLIQRLTDKDGKIREWIPFLDNHDVERWINWIRSQHGDTVTEESCTQINNRTTRLIWRSSYIIIISWRITNFI